MSTELRKFGRYEVQALLGRGGMAEVWKAFDTKLRRYVAIKVLHPSLQDDPQFVARFEHEARIIASLHHPNIVQLYDYQISTSSLSEAPLAYMVMDYIEGQTLASYLRSTSHAGKFPSPVELLALFTPICLAVDYAHQQGMIHRDLKPSNILLDERNKVSLLSGEPIISDFGISKLLAETTASQSLQGSLSGTPAYISPEQVQGRRSDGRSDIYSLSVILYEVCTGVLPYHAETPMALALQHVTGTPLPPALINPSISSALASVILHGLAKDPQMRFPRSSHLLVALTDALNLPVPEGVLPGIYATNFMDEAQVDRKNFSPPVSSHLQLSSSVAFRANIARLPTSPLRATASPRALPHTPLTSFTHVISNRRYLLSRPVWQIGTLALLILALLVAGFMNIPPPTRAVLLQGSGMISFLNSWQINQNGRAGVTDEVQVDMENLPPLLAGKAYYAWLLTDTDVSDEGAALLGVLPVKDNVTHFRYNGDSKHTNLLANYSRFLITEEDASLPPVGPSPNSWRYYGQIAQQPSPTDTVNHYTLLDHLRHLVSVDPTMQSYGLYGGLNLWLSRNAENLLTVVSLARDEKDSARLHLDLLRTLDYLDGSKYISIDLPPGTPFLVDPPAGRVGFLTFDPQAKLLGLLTHVQQHLEGMVDSPGSSLALQNVAAHLDEGMKVIQQDFMLAHQDAKQLVAFNNAQLSQPSARTLLNDLYQQVNLAYVGQMNTKDSNSQDGIERISDSLQQLAVIAIKPASGPE